MWTQWFNAKVAVLFALLVSGVATAGTGASPVADPRSQSGTYETTASPSWHIETVDYVGSCFDSGASLALDSSGVPHISYLNSTDDALMYAYRATSGWVTTVVDNSEAVGKHSLIALDSSGHPHISYRDATNNALKYARWDGSNWILEFVGGIGESGWYTSLALDSDDRPHISYLGSGQKVKYAHWNGDRWDISIVDPTFTSWGTSLALESLGRPHISYGREGSLRYASYESGQWTGETVDVGISGDSTLVGAYSSLAIDDRNNPHISYARYGQTLGGDWPNDLRYARKQDERWHIESPDTQGAVGYYTSIALDGQRRPHISYWDYDHNVLKYAFWDGANWVVFTVGPAYLSGYTSLKVNKHGLAHIAYCDDDRIKLAQVLPSSASIPTTGGSLTSPLDQIAYIFPSGTFTDTVTVTHTTHFGRAPSAGSLIGIGRFFEITAIHSSTGQPAQPTRPYTVTVQYADAERGPAIENTLALYYWDGTQWVRESTSVVAPEANMVTATPDHFGLWAVLGETRRVFLPVILKSYPTAVPFPVFLEPAMQTLPAGASASFSVSVPEWRESWGPLYWSVVGLPPGITAEFWSTARPFYRTLVIDTSCATPPGSYVLDIQVTISETTYTANITVEVTGHLEESQPGSFTGSFTANTFGVSRGGPTTFVYGPFLVLQFCESTQPRKLKVTVQSATSDAGTPMAEPPPFSLFRSAVWPVPDHIQTNTGYVANAKEVAQNEVGNLEWNITEGLYVLVFQRSPLEASRPPEQRPASVTYSVEIVR